MSGIPEPQQPRVPPESPSWCISALALQCWNERGQLLQKAHHTEAKTDPLGYEDHWATCGTYMRHFSANCAPAPEGWPACRKCVKDASVAVPKAFREALP